MREGVSKDEEYSERYANDRQFGEGAFPDGGELLAGLVLVNAFEEYGGADGDEEEDSSPDVFQFFFLVVEGLGFLLFRGLDLDWLLIWWRWGLRHLDVYSLILGLKLNSLYFID